MDDQLEFEFMDSLFLALFDRYQGRWLQPNEIDWVGFELNQLPPAPRSKFELI